MHFYDGIWLFWGLINDDNFHFSPSKLFPFGDEGILPYLSFFFKVRATGDLPITPKRQKFLTQSHEISSGKWVRRREMSQIS